MVDDTENVQLQDVVEPVAETVQESAATPVQAAPPVEDDKAYNIRQLRLQADAAQRERDQLARELREIRAKLEPQRTEEPEQDIHINPDDFVEGKHLSAYDRKLKRLEQEMNAAKQQAQQLASEALIHSKYPDFDSVVTNESLQALQRDHPEIAATIAANTNLQTQAGAAYKIIKQLGIKPNYDAEQAIIEKNQAKPKPLASLSPQHSDSPLTHANAFANGLTQDLKDKLYKEMNDAINNA
jgi:hypothetical protein